MSRWQSHGYNNVSRCEWMCRVMLSVVDVGCLRMSKIPAFITVSSRAIFFSSAKLLVAHGYALSRHAPLHCRLEPHSLFLLPSSTSQPPLQRITASSKRLARWRRHVANHASSTYSSRALDRSCR